MGVIPHQDFTPADVNLMGHQILQDIFSEYPFPIRKDQQPRNTWVKSSQADKNDYFVFKRITEMLILKVKISTHSHMVLAQMWGSRNFHTLGRETNTISQGCSSLKYGLALFIYFMCILTYNFFCLVFLLLGLYVIIHICL